MKQAFARLCLTLNSVKYPFLFMTELCWVPGPFVLNIHAASAAFHWTCLGCQSLAFGQCGTIWKAWVNSWPHGNKKIVSNDSTSEQDVQGSLFNKFAHGCRGCASSISKPKNTFHDHQWFDCFFLCHPPMPCVFQFVPMPTGSKQQYRKYEWCYQTRHTHHAGGMSTNEDLQTDQCLMNLKHSPSSWQRG